jgi:hypothetical protein
MKRFWPVFALLLSACAAYAAEIPIVGLDDEGNEVTYLQSEDAYVARMRAAATAVGESIVPSLESLPARWMLRTTVVGIGVGVQVGVGPVIQLKATPRFRLVYSNSKDPVIP